MKDSKVKMALIGEGHVWLKHPKVVLCVDNLAIANVLLLLPVTFFFEVIWIEMFFPLKLENVSASQRGIGGLLKADNGLEREFEILCVIKFSLYVGTRELSVCPLNLHE